MDVIKAETTDIDSVGRFNLPEEEVRARTGEYLAQIEETPSNYVGVVITPESPMFDVACTLERQIFEAAFEGNDTEYMENKYGPLTDTSRFLLVIEKEEEGGGMPVCFMRLVLPEEGSATTMSIEDASPNIGKTAEEIRDIHDIVDLHQCWDVATLGLVEKYRDTMESVDIRILINRMFYNLASQDGIKHMVSIIDKDALKGLLLVGIPVVPMGDPEGEFNDSNAFGFDGSGKSFAVFGDITKYWDSVNDKYTSLEATQDQAGPAFIRKIVGQLLKGEGMDDRIILPSI